MTNRRLPYERSAQPSLSARVRPHGAVYLLPAITLAVGVACAGLAGLQWVAPHVLGPLRDTTTYGDGNPVPPRHHEEHAGLHLLLGGSGAAVVLALIGFIGVAILRRRSR
jgi:hypothetical protein